MSKTRDFGLIVIGDEILFGNRRDRHLEHFREMLKRRGMQLVRCWLLPDEPETLTNHLRLSMQDRHPVFVCGGIGATPDDKTRTCAALASGRALERHPDAAALITERFGEQAYPSRILMADLPAGCRLIPNPVSRIPGFSVGDHHFLPGFPQMAWPMAEWVLEQDYPETYALLQERSLRVLDTPESELIPVMERLAGRFAGLKMFSLPRMGDQPHIELGFRGSGDCDVALHALRQVLTLEGIPYELRSSRGVED